LVFLYANLFCYVASYPILLFHATRVIDFSDGKWPARPLLDGYIATIALAIAALCVPPLISSECRYWFAFALVLSFVVLQTTRMYIALSHRVPVDGLLGTVNPAYGLVYALARRRGIPEEIKTTKPAPKAVAASGGAPKLGYDADEEGETRRRITWRPEVVETYRHLREHGNSAFIFVLELVLASLVYCILARPGQSPLRQMGAIGVLLALWALPAMFVHLLGQHLERRFSVLERRLKPTDQ